MLLRQIKSESYGVLRYKPFRPSLSANNAENQQVAIFHPVLHPLLVKLGVIFCSLLYIGYGHDDNPVDCWQPPVQSILRIISSPSSSCTMFWDFLINPLLITLGTISCALKGQNYQT